MQTTSTNDLNQYVESTMKRFKLVDMREQYTDIIAQATNTSMTYLEFLVRLLSVEEDGKNVRREESLLDKASFDSTSTLEDIDYSFNATLDQARIEELGKLHFCQKKKILSSLVHQESAKA